MTEGHRDWARGTDCGPAAPRGGRRRLPRPARALLPLPPPPPSALKTPGTCVSATSQWPRPPRCVPARAAPPPPRPSLICRLGFRGGRGARERAARRLGDPGRAAGSVGCARAGRAPAARTSRREPARAGRAGGLRATAPPRAARGRCEACCGSPLRRPRSREARPPRWGVSRGAAGPGGTQPGALGREPRCPARGPAGPAAAPPRRPGKRRPLGPARCQRPVCPRSPGCRPSVSTPGVRGTAAGRASHTHMHRVGAEGAPTAAPGPVP